MRLTEVLTRSCELRSSDSCSRPKPSEVPPVLGICVAWLGSVAELCAGTGWRGPQRGFAGSGWSRMPSRRQAPGPGNPGVGLPPPLSTLGGLPRPTAYLRSHPRASSFSVIGVDNNRFPRLREGSLGQGLDYPEPAFGGRRLWEALGQL